LITLRIADDAVPVTFPRSAALVAPLGGRVERLPRGDRSTPDPPDVRTLFGGVTGNSTVADVGMITRFDTNRPSMVGERDTNG